MYFGIEAILFGYFGGPGAYYGSVLRLPARGAKARQSVSPEL